EQGDSILAVATNGHAGVPLNILNGLSNLKLVSSFGVGYDGIDTDACVKRGVLVSHTPNVLNEDVADTAILLMLACARELVFNDQYVRAGRWVSEGSTPLTQSPEGRKVGILGLGRIGERI